MTYELIRLLCSDYSISRLCEILSVSRSAYYAYDSGRSYIGSEKKQRESREVASVFWEHKRRYGSRRIRAELLDLGKQIGRHRIRSIMRELDLKAIQPKSFVPKTTVPCHSRLRSPNLLLDKSNLPKGINKVAVGDITYLPKTGEDWFYLCTWMDLYSRMIVGWKVRDNMEASIAVDSLKMLIKQRNPPQGMIIHSDGGGQFIAGDFRRLLDEKRLRQSMTRVENHYDNAFAESLFSRFKAELLSEFKVFESLRDAKYKTFEYIEGYYNIKRRHSSLGYKSPLQFESALE